MRLFFVALGLLLVALGAARADAISDCNQEKDQDLKIRGCTLIIEGARNRFLPKTCRLLSTAAGPIRRKAIMTAPSPITTKPSALSRAMYYFVHRGRSL